MNQKNLGKFKIWKWKYGGSAHTFHNMSKYLLIFFTFTVFFSNFGVPKFETP